MNYLAHLALSGDNEEIIAGNFIGDSLKGVNIADFSPGIQKGIRLHRFIDDFTDHHPVFIEAKKVFSKKFDKYSGTLVDVCFDHFLARSFYDFQLRDLQQFSNEKYSQLKNHYNVFPEKAKLFYNFMTENNILYSYSEVEGIKKVLQGLSQRIGNGVQLQEGYSLFMKNYEVLEKLFKKFYREIKFACSEFLETVETHKKHENT